MASMEQAQEVEPVRLEQLDLIRKAAQELAELERHAREVEISSAFRIQRTTRVES